MGYEFLYAYLENLYILSIVLLIVFGLVLAVLIYARAHNEIDRDDWANLMLYFGIPFVFALFIVAAPGMEHIKEIRKEFSIKEEQPINLIKGEPNEVFTSSPSSK